MSKFYISEENLGSEATQEQAEAMVSHMKGEGFECEYGPSEKNVIESDEDYYAFLHVFNTKLGLIPTE